MKQTIDAWNLVIKTQQWACSGMQDGENGMYCIEKETLRENSLVLQLQGEMLPGPEASQSPFPASVFLFPSSYSYLNSSLKIQ